MKEIIKLIRPLNCFMAGLATLFSLWLANVLKIDLFLLAFVSVFLICAAGMLINDYFDIEIDRINKPEKWKITKKYGKKLAVISMIFFSTGIFLSVFLGIGAFILAFANSLILVFYPWKLKKILFLKNIVVAYLVASVFLYGGIISQNPLPVIFAIIAFVSNIGREIIKDVADLEGDKKAGVKTLPAVMGKMGASIFSISFTISSIFLAPLPYFLKIFSENYLLLILPAIFGFAYTCVLSLISPVKAAKWSKISMFLAILAFIGARIS